MKTLLVAIVAGSMLALAPGQAQADTVARTVTGFAYPAGLAPLTESCTTGSPPRPTALYRKGGARGTHSTGLSFGGATGYESGVQAKVATPRSLTSVSFATYHPQGPDADTASDGHFAARYDPTGNNFQNGYYYAYLGLDATRTGWGTWSNLADASLSWSWWDGATSTPNQYTGTVRAIANASGTNGSGAWVGFEFGCNGRHYYMDDFRVGTSLRTTVYDFEGVRSRSYLSTAPTHHSTRVKRDVTRLNLAQGQGHWLWGDASGYSDTVLRAAWLSGNASLYAKPYGASSYRRVGTGRYTYQTWAKFKVTARKRVQYQIRTGSSATHEAAVSKTLDIWVQRRIKAQAEDRVVRRGRSIKVTGQLFPGDRGVRVTLQRKVGVKWRPLASGKSRAHGRYSIRARASSAGKWRLRVIVGSAKGNLGNQSPSMRITIKRPKRTPQPDPVSPPVVVENPVPPTHVPSSPEVPGDDIKARGPAPLTQLPLQVPFAVPAHSRTRTFGSVVSQPGVGQR